MKFRTLSLVAVLSSSLAGGAIADMVTPDIIFGSGNVNRGFEVSSTADGLELGLRAKQRYTSPSDALMPGTGKGIDRDAAGNYIFDTTGDAVPLNRSFWNFDWSINSDTNAPDPGIATTFPGDALDTYTYQMLVDIDPTAAISFIVYDPISPALFGSTGFYLGNNATPNGGAPFTPADGTATPDFSAFNVAQNSVNMGFLGVPASALGAGQFTVTLRAFTTGASPTPAASTTINVFVDTLPTAVPVPASALLLLVGLGAIGFSRNRAVV